ncbi:nucleophile aminohydrolase [Pelagophyceae sp. CCMP2097]|nr:nucleophile aminohydrolase [Pelagophyceae sp. CCMP2097]
MCRWLVYCSETPIRLYDLVLSPSNSLVKQSFEGGFHPKCASQNNMTLNADGFGVGWYGCEGDAAVFRSVTPAWSNRNLRELTSVVRSKCCFAHVRAATPGSVVNEENCHPFRYGRLLWQHNGHIEGFVKLKRRIIAMLPDDLFSDVVKGQTDSEYCFALLLAQLRDPKRKELFGAAELEFAMLNTLALLQSLLETEGITDGFSTCNFALTDGGTVIITRYCDKAPEIPSPSLYFTFREAQRLQEALMTCDDGEPGEPAIAAPAYGIGAGQKRPPLASCKLDGAYGGKNCPRQWRCSSPAFMCASEPLSQHTEYWSLVPENTLLTFSLEHSALHMSSIPNLKRRMPDQGRNSSGALGDLDNSRRGAAPDDAREPAAGDAAASPRGRAATACRGRAATACERVATGRDGAATARDGAAAVPGPERRRAHSTPDVFSPDPHRGPLTAPMSAQILADFLQNAESVPVWRAKYLKRSNSSNSSGTLPEPHSPGLAYCAQQPQMDLDALSF